MEEGGRGGQEGWREGKDKARICCLRERRNRKVVEDGWQNGTEQVRERLRQKKKKIKKQEESASEREESLKEETP